MAQVLELSKFNMRSISFTPNDTNGPVIVLIGKRNTGKSILVKDILYHHQDVPKCTVISGTEISNGFFRDIVPKIFIHNEYNTGIIENILRVQKKCILEKSEQEKKFGRSSIDARTIVIMDDCLYDDKWCRDKLMRLLFMNGRHWKVMLIITMQYPLGILPALRTNIDYVFILRDNSRKGRERLFENYCSSIGNLDTFSQLLNQVTENYECMLINNVTQSNALKDQIFWYKADLHENFKICDKHFWELSKSAPDNDELFSTYDANNIKRRPNAPLIQVKKR